MKKAISGVVAAVLTAVVVVGSFEKIDECNVGAVKRVGQAVRDMEPGLNWKIPIAESVTEYQVCELKATENLSAATRDQLAITAEVSFNWKPVRSEVLTIIREYGSPREFLDNIVTPRVIDAAKETLGKFTYEEMIQKRGEVGQALKDTLAAKIAGFPVVARQALIEDVSAPEAYKQAVREKQIAQQQAEREKHKLEQQRLQAQQKVNTATAEAEAIAIVARANAERISIEGEALAANPEVLSRLRIEAWKEGGSQVPEVLSIGSEGQDFIYSLSPKQ